MQGSRQRTSRPSSPGTDIGSVSLDSLTEGLVYNDDGSLDIYIGVECPPGQEGNYLRTIGDDGWFVYYRLYGPTEPFFDKSWALPDFVRLTNPSAP
jgi:hypothetical protein